MTLLFERQHGLGRPDRRILLDPEPFAGLTALPKLATRPIAHSELWADTSETLGLSDYQFLAQLGYSGCFRYVPLAGGAGGISAAEMAAALSVKTPSGAPFALAFVQFARTSGIDASSGKADGAAAVAYLTKLGVPNKVCWSQDLFPTSSANAIAYSNANFDAAVAAGWFSTSLPMYAEPGYPLNSDERYSALHVHAYWATAANDPSRFPSHRGCQIVQSWGSSRGEWFPRPGLVIDTDLVQLDWFNASPIVLIGTS